MNIDGTSDIKRTTQGGSETRPLAAAIPNIRKDKDDGSTTTEESIQ